MDPTQNNAQPPSAPTGTSEAGLPPASGQDSELYNQIAGQDLDPQVVKKKNKSLLMSLMVQVMRLTLWIDSVKRTHERAFRFMGGVWALCMAIIYFSGVLVLVFALYNRMQLPIYLEDQMHARDIQFESAEYSMDRIVVRDLKDKSGTYTVDTMIIYSTFTDLLQKRIRLVTLDGLNILLNTNSNFNILQDIPQFLAQIQNPTRGRLDLTINAVTVHNAKLTLKNQQVDIPISFSMEGMYDDQTQIVIPLSIKQPALQAKATLTIAGSNQYPEWNLAVSEGVITLPRSSPENITGELKVTLNQQNLDTIQADFKMGYGTIEKHITANLRAKDDNNLGGQISWEKNNLTEQDLSSDLTFNVSSFSLSNTNEIHITGPLTVSSKRFNASNFGLSNLSTALNVNMHCQNWDQCRISLKDKSVVTVQDAWFQNQRQLIQSKDGFQFTLQPQEEALVLREENPYILFQLPIESFAFEGNVEGASQGISLQTNSVTLSGAVADTNTDASRLAISAQNLSYQATGIALKNATFSTDNLLSKTSNVQLQSDSVQLSDLPLFSHPFRLNMSMLGNKATARLDFQDTPISMKLDGQLSLSQKAFAGQVQVFPFNLSELSVPLYELWPSISPAIKNVTGQMIANGQVTWLGSHNITGPLNIGFKDVSFDVDNTRISGLNTVLTLDALRPSVTKNNQHMFIHKVSGLIPFQDLDVVFQLDGQNLRLHQFSVLGAGIPLSLPASVIPTKNANALLYLKNDHPIQPKDFKKGINLNGLDITAGTANLSIPLELQNGVFSVPNITLKMQNVLAQRSGNVYNNVFGTSDNYFIRSGQVIMDRNNVLQLVFNGRLLPSKSPKDVQFNSVPTPNGLFKELPTHDLPQDIVRRLTVLFDKQ